MSFALPRPAPRRCFTALVCLLSLLGSVQAQRDPLEMQALAEAGAPGLALSMMDRFQPAYTEAPEQWMRWEGVRFKVMMKHHMWNEAIERMNQLPDSLQTVQRNHFAVHAVQAYVNMGMGSNARDVLRKMIWDQHNPIDQEQFQKLRRLVVESYLIDHLLDDARIALLRYQQDYGADSPQERLLHARVLLRANEPHAVVNLLSSDKSHEGKALYLMARLQSSTDQPDNVWRAALKQIRNSRMSKKDQAPYWVVAAYAAGVSAQYNKQAWFLERALATVVELDARDPIFVVRADDLWDAYIAAGNMLGNDAHLLIGEDEAWLNMAQAVSDKDAPKARIIYALLTERGSTSEVKENSHRQLVQLLRAEQGGDSIVSALYLNSRRYADSTTIPYPIRYVLANDALGRDQIPLASTLMGDIDDPPDGVDQQLWYLRWARVHILGGQVDRGIENLYNFLASIRQLDRALADRVLQVVFDLQKIERYQDAANLFTVILPRISDVQQKREVLFWLADSYKAMGEYEQAARMYLRSAGLIDAYAMDPWAQTARYHAAQALAQSGLIEDARMILEHLLSVTPAPERRSVLKHQLQQLHLENR